jgi:hypothetical protein
VLTASLLFVSQVYLLVYFMLPVRVEQQSDVSPPHALALLVRCWF